MRSRLGGCLSMSLVRRQSPAMKGKAGLPVGAASSQAAFAALLGMWLFITVLTTSQYSPMMSNVNVVRVSLIAVMLLCDLAFASPPYRDSKVRLCHVVLLGCFAALTAVCAGVRDFSLPQVLAIAYCARRFDGKFLARAFTWAASIAVLFVVGSCLAGVLPDYVTSMRGSAGRHSLGFNYSTFLSHYYLAIVAAYAYSRGFRPPAPTMLVAALLDVAILAVSDSRNSFILVLLILAACCYAKLRRPRRGASCRPGARGHSPLLLWLLKYSPAILALASAALFLGVGAASPAGEWLDGHLSDRLRLTQEAFAQYPVGALGNVIHWGTPQYLGDGASGIGYIDKELGFVALPYLYVDCSYLNVLITDGWLVSLFALALLCALSIYAVRNGDLPLAVVIAVMCIHAVFDPQLLLLHYNPALLFLAKPWFDAPGAKAAGVAASPQRKPPIRRMPPTRDPQGVGGDSR